MGSVQEMSYVIGLSNLKLDVSLIHDLAIHDCHLLCYRSGLGWGLPNYY